MKTITLLTTLALVLTACGSGDTGTRPDETPGVLAAALLELVTENHTFGEGPPPFSEYLIQSSLDPHAGDPTGDATAIDRDLTSAERSAIEAALAALGPVRWIDDPDAWRTPDLMPTLEGSVILGVGEPRFDGDQALVPVSLWCGGLCGTWLTYRLE
jgi:hypothetical protein